MDRAARAYARAAVLHAVAAAETFLEGVVGHMDVDPEIDAKTDDALDRLRRDISRNGRLGDEWRRLSALLEAVDGAADLPDSGDRKEVTDTLMDQVRKRMLDLAIEHCREHLHDKRLSRELGRLSDLRSALGRRALKSGPLARRWFEGATGLPGSGASPGEETGRDFRRIVGKARGESASAGAGGAGEAGGAPDITVEEARLACGAVRSMIASVCGAAGREVPRWVREIHDRVT